MTVICTARVIVSASGVASVTLIRENLSERTTFGLTSKKPYQNQYSHNTQQRELSSLLFKTHSLDKVYLHTEIRDYIFMIYSTAKETHYAISISIRLAFEFVLKLYPGYGRFGPF